MRSFLYIILSALLVFSGCCKTKECKCDLEEPFLNIEAQKWVEPLAFRERVFIDSANQEMLYDRNFKQYIFCVGEGECCTDFPYITVDYKDFNSELELLHVNALKNDVTFTSPDGGQLGFLNAPTGIWSVQNDIEIIEFDTNYANLNRAAIRIKNLKNRQGIAFIELTYVKQFGVISYMDLNAKKWILK